MARRMSVFLTLDAVRAQIKTETRRDTTTWSGLKPGDPLTLIEKGQGIPKGGHQVVVAEVTVTDVYVERLDAITTEEVRAEGFPAMTPAEFVVFWLHAHHVPDDERDGYLVRVIRWTYDTAEQARSLLDDLADEVVSTAGAGFRP